MPKQKSKPKSKSKNKPTPKTKPTPKPKPKVVTLNQSDEEIKGQLLGSLLLFTEVFFKMRTGKEFRVSRPIGRESHHITICKALTKVMRGEIKRLIINVPPRYSKTELLIHFVAWCMARYPDCNFLYTSYAHGLAARQTSIVRDIINLQDYRLLFGVDLKQSTKAKHEFDTTSGGSVYAAGLAGTITGRGGGIRGCPRFGGALIIDDAHKPEEVHSDDVREGVIEWVDSTLKSRRNDGLNTPIIFIGQCLHEHDLSAHLEKEDKEGWEVVKIPALDVAGNALDPELHSIQDLLQMKDINSYVFYSQYQQTPQPPGGGLYKEDDFLVKEFEPKLLMTFITADTAETDKTYNDATVFSLWGLYKVKQGDIETDIYALHWLDCEETWVEPKDLEQEFMTFYLAAMRRDVKPGCAIIEKASTGTTLASLLEKIQGLDIIKLDRRTKADKSKDEASQKFKGISKSERFRRMQPTVAQKLVSLPFGAKHTKMCIDHMSKITGNDTHSRDDICDTLQMAIELALVDQSIINRYIYPSMDKTADNIMKKLANKHRHTQKLRGARQWLN